MSRVFNGTSEFVTFTDRARGAAIGRMGLLIDHRPFAMSLWYYATKAVSNRQVIISDWTSNGAATSFAFQINDGVTSDGTIALVAVGASNYTTSTKAVANQWGHLFYHWDGTNVFGYVNGALKLTGTLSSFSTSGQTLSIGRAGAYADLYFGGSVANVTLWRGVGFGPGHVLDLWKGADPTKINPGSIMFHMPMLGMGSEPVYGPYGVPYGMQLNFSSTSIYGGAHPPVLQQPFRPSPRRKGKVFA